MARTTVHSPLDQDGKPGVGIRRNGNAKDRPSGSPQSRGHPFQFLLPDNFTEVVLRHARKLAPETELDANAIKLSVTGGKKKEKLRIVRAFVPYCTALPYTSRRAPMDTTTVNRFRDSLKSFVEQVVRDHVPLRVTRRNGADFVVMSAEDWERDQETLYVPQNSSLMRQIIESSTTHKARTGYTPTREQVDEILGDCLKRDRRP